MRLVELVESVCVVSGSAGEDVDVVVVCFASVVKFRLFIVSPVYVMSPKIFLPFLLF